MLLNESKRIIILGAGSSIGHSKGLFPSITGFFASAKKLGINLNADYSEIVEYIKSTLRKDVLDDEDHFVDIEDLFTSIEIELERKSSPKFVEIRHKFLELIRNVLLGIENDIKDQKGDYDDLVNPDLKFLSQSDTIITFNWDILLDNRLGRKEKLGDKRSSDAPMIRKQYEQFVGRLSARYEDTWAGSLGAHPPYQNWSTTFGYYLKVHGSIDWFYCANELCRRWYRVHPLLEPWKDHYCSECHEKIDSLLIPPVLNKGYQQSPLIRQIWSLAAQEIRIATDLIIWGYSLPPTDFHSKWLLRQARKSQLKSLVVINPDITKKDFTNRFIDMYKGELSETSIFFYKEFVDYLKTFNS